MGFYFRILVLIAAGSGFTVGALAQQTPALPRAPSSSVPPAIQMLQNDPDPLPDSHPARSSKSPGAGTVSCRGVFGKNSDHHKLAAAFGAGNVEFTGVEGPPGANLKASVAFPNDPKRRLEVLWTDDASRSGTSMIVIAGHSAWTAPKGLRLGLPLAALEKLNGKPFRLTGFGDNGAHVIGWDDGALDRLPGGCKVGIRLALGRTPPEEAREQVANASELRSNEPAVRAVRAEIAEIILGY